MMERKTAECRQDGPRATVEPHYGTGRSRWSGWIETLGLIAFVAFIAVMINSRHLWAFVAAWFSGL
ncbi:MAG TPA: hypothetical protein VKY65_19945 [Alphaproteobacteria bacterium]|nr:hypothetical protein [Alphaproteobacteria bacterium]